MKPYAPGVIMITGATSGFGEAMARLFAETFPRCALILTGRRQERLEALRAALPVPVHALAQDITDTDKVRRDIETLPAEFSGIDLLVNNAGLALGTAPFAEAAESDFYRMIDTNIKGLVATTRAVLPGMIARGGGHVINIGSTAGNYAYPGGNVYCGTKAFVNHFSLALRADVRGQNIRVTAVEPGAVETEFSLVRYKGDAGKAGQVYAGHRSLSADHIARTVAWIAAMPEEMNINAIEIMPTDQSFAGLCFDTPANRSRE